ncbi:MAG: monooxygenase [Betaproteobacteria bacterium]|nr:monooxygenase [Betaproteobacteria bacterium]
MKIAIAGGGIGGLTTALALTQAGIAVTVYERSSQLVDLGAGITLAPNATRVLYHLGLGPALEQTAVTPPVSEYRHYRTGAVIMRMVPKDYRQLFGVPYLRMHRWDLQEAMINHLAEIAPGALKLNARVEQLESRGSEVKITFGDGRVETADIVIAADGIRSALREKLFSPAPPVFSGYVAWRGLVDTATLPPQLRESAVAFGQGRHINRYLVRRGELLNFVAVAQRTQWAEEGWAIPAPRDEFLDEFSSFDEGTRTILSRAAQGQVFKWGLFGRPWLEQWHSGRVVLLGDAAHPMLPFLGQGGANAIEDAMILARCLASQATPQQAFALYQASRGPRTRKATDEAAKRGERYLGEPTADSLKGDNPEGQYAYDAVAGPLGV